MPTCFGFFYRKWRQNGEFPLKNDDFVLKNGDFFCNSRYGVLPGSYGKPEANGFPETFWGTMTMALELGLEKYSQGVMANWLQYYARANGTTFYVCFCVQMKILVQKMKILPLKTDDFWPESYWHAGPWA